MQAGALRAGDVAAQVIADDGEPLTAGEDLLRQLEHDGLRLANHFRLDSTRSLDGREHGSCSGPGTVGRGNDRVASGSEQPRPIAEGERGGAQFLVVKALV